MGRSTTVQSMTHGVDILLYSPWPMESTHCLNHCTIHDPWSTYTTVQYMTCGTLYLCTAHESWSACALVQPMGYGYIYYCTTHEPWAKCTAVQPMDHGVNILLYSPWPMESAHCPNHCTVHGLWVYKLLYSPRIVGIYTIVQPMTHGVDILLYSP